MPASSPPPSDDVTRLLSELRGGDASAFERLLPLVYSELRRIARSQRRRNARPSETLATTALVHEAYLKLLRSDSKFHNREHFYAVAATAMRQLLVDQARKHLSEKRGGNMHRISLDDDKPALDQMLAEDDDAERVAAQAAFLVDLDDALAQLGREEPRCLRVVECRFFGGMTAGETAAALEIAERTVQRDWIKARVWLELRLGQSASTHA